MWGWMACVVVAWVIGFAFYRIGYSAGRDAERSRCLRAVLDSIPGSLEEMRKK